MRASYDPKVDALSLVLTDEAVVRTVEVDAGLSVDLDAEEKVVAIEILGVTEDPDLTRTLYA